MNRAAHIVASLLETDEFDARAYLTDPDAKTAEVLEQIRRKLMVWYNLVDIFPAIEGTAAFPRFYYQGNRYRIRCRRTTPIPPEDQDMPRKGAAKRFRDGIANSILHILEDNEYYVDHLEFAGNTFTNLLIIIDTWPIHGERR